MNDVSRTFERDEGLTETSARSNDRDRSIGIWFAGIERGEVRPPQKWNTGGESLEVVHQAHLGEMERVGKGVVVQRPRPVGDLGLSVDYWTCHAESSVFYRLWVSGEELVDN